MNREVQTDTKKVGQPDRPKDMNREGQKNRNREGQSDKNTQRSMDSKADLQTSKEKCGICGLCENVEKEREGQRECMWNIPCVCVMCDVCEICRKRGRGIERVCGIFPVCVCDV